MPSTAGESGAGLGPGGKRQGASVLQPLGRKMESWEYRRPAGASSLRDRRVFGSMGSGRPHMLHHPLRREVTCLGFGAPGAGRVQAPPHSKPSPFFCKMGVRRCPSHRVTREEEPNEASHGTSRARSPARPPARSFIQQVWLEYPLCTRYCSRHRAEQTRSWPSRSP